jgi:hypothetical protein
VLFHVLAHVDPHHLLLRVEQFKGEGLGKLRFSHACRAQEEERPCGLVLSPHTRARTQHCLGDGFDSYNKRNDFKVSSTYFDFCISFFPIPIRSPFLSSALTFVLSYDALVKHVSQMQQAFFLRLAQLCDGDARPPADHFRNLFSAHGFAEH